MFVSDSLPERSDNSIGCDAGVLTELEVAAVLVFVLLAGPRSAHDTGAKISGAAVGGPTALRVPVRSLSCNANSERLLRLKMCAAEESLAIARATGAGETASFLRDSLAGGLRRAQADCNVELCIDAMIK